MTRHRWAPRPASGCSPSRYRSVRVQVAVASSLKLPSGPPAGSPVATHGRLATRGNRIVNASGDPVQLRGVAFHGLQWFGDFYRDGRVVEAAATEWGADVVRVAVSLHEGGYLMAERYASLPNVIDEIANEPDRTGAAGIAFHTSIDEVAGRIPLFATEWAAASWQRTSENDLVKAQPWIELLNRRGISWTSWSFCPATVSSAVSAKEPRPMPARFRFTVHHDYSHRGKGNRWGAPSGGSEARR